MMRKPAPSKRAMTSPACPLPRQSGFRMMSVRSIGAVVCVRSKVVTGGAAAGEAEGAEVPSVGPFPLVGEAPVLAAGMVPVAAVTGVKAAAGSPAVACGVETGGGPEAGEADGDTVDGAAAGRTSSAAKEHLGPSATPPHIMQRKNRAEERRSAEGKRPPARANHRRDFTPKLPLPDPTRRPGSRQSHRPKTGSSANAKNITTARMDIPFSFRHSSPFTPYP